MKLSVESLVYSKPDYTARPTHLIISVYQELFVKGAVLAAAVNQHRLTKWNSVLQSMLDLMEWLDSICILPQETQHRITDTFAVARAEP